MKRIYYRSNSNPRITAMYFINTLKELKLAPCKVITDCGTENVLIAAIQSKLMDNVEAHRYVTSTANQRIENWWSHNRKGYTGWLIHFFKQMVDDNEISLGNDIHMELLWFVFSSLLQTDLDKVRVEWNTHYIRRTRHETVPGRPDELFFLPEDSGFTEQGKYISVYDVEEAYSGEENLLEDGDNFATVVDEELTEC